MHLLAPVWDVACERRTLDHRLGLACLVELHNVGEIGGRCRRRHWIVNVENRELPCLQIKEAHLGCQVRYSGYLD